MLEEIPRSGTDSLPLWLGHLGVRAPYATRRKPRYEANQVWMNTTFISQGPQSWGKLAVKTWRVKIKMLDKNAHTIGAIHERTLKSDEWSLIFWVKENECRAMSELSKKEFAHCSKRSLNLKETALHLGGQTGGGGEGGEVDMPRLRNRS
jgi:hypothetical protein